ncbi:NAD(P)-binding protein [Myriangium duriaei CBS 260.36]|uniref:NAD(P)-binding protein n=1 Tax=Myriangium duriaei CBS 260.36 TaxID=1168546 RepID=A0A9P4J2Y6_9PEZI|nr:NAD(P)-binding protein [Myriangium duriaei CBS 260.36]
MTIPTTRQIALVTGGNTGIGLAVATSLATDHGYHVIIASRNPSAGQEAAATLTSAGHSASSIQLDVTSDASISAAVAQISADFGKLDVLINNAGILLDLAPEEHRPATTRELWRSTFDTNVFGAAVLTEACAPLLLKASPGARVVFVSSAMGSIKWSLEKEQFWYSMDCKSYDSSKAAMNMLASQWDRELGGKGVMVNAVCPGLVQTKATGFHPAGTTTDVGAKRIVEVATAGKGAASGTFSNRDGEIPW